MQWSRFTTSTTHTHQGLTWNCTPSHHTTQSPSTHSHSQIHPTFTKLHQIFYQHIMSKSSSNHQKIVMAQLAKGHPYSVELRMYSSIHTNSTIILLTCYLFQLSPQLLLLLSIFLHTFLFFYDLSFCTKLMWLIAGLSVFSQSSRWNISEGLVFPKIYS
jgi:hypothetical protein